MTIVLGIDGGGTGTQAVLADEYGKVYASVEVGPTNPNAVSYEKLDQTIQYMLAELKKQAPGAYEQIQIGFAGMSGVGDSSKSSLVETIFAKYVGEDFDVIVYNDAISALYARTLGEPGIVQIAGTGSITYGINDRGESSRIGGWGYLFGDEGSGYAIGQATIRMAFHTRDGKIEADQLMNRVKEHYGVDVVPDIIPVVYNSNSPRETIASLSKTVFDLYDQGDEFARSIIEQAASDLAQSIHTMLTNHFNGKQYVVLAGGLFKRQDVLLPLLEKRLGESALLTVMDLEPVVGSVVAALKEVNVRPASHFREQMKVVGTKVI
ncbi:N-acetylglucosamine kinase [Alkalibacillus aidingensis]|uniref:N-acetylglucosamine kinase n=1 Tax=Alkalibacillus aidingensis TaxID=2747607 RepID=UPI0016611885|nr:ROK family protein [Alkalibacillus aidingensis]